MSYLRREIKCRKYGDEAKIRRIEDRVVFVFCPPCGEGQRTSVDNPDLSEVMRETLKAKTASLTYRPRIRTYP